MRSEYCGAMARTARLHFPGGLFHVISRCVAGKHLLDDPEIRAAYVDLLGRTASRLDCQVLAYCVMGNHAHVVLIQGQDALSELFKPLHVGVSYRVNHKRRGKYAKGPVFAQRPRSVLVDEETYLLELVRYVHNNPVRAGVVRKARDSSWSSHRAYLGLDECPEWLHTGYVLQRLGKQRARAMMDFEAFMREGAKEERRPDFSGGEPQESQREAVHVLESGLRVSDGMLGDGAFLARVSRDVRAADDALKGGRLRGRLEGPPPPKASLTDVVEAVCEASGLDRLDLDIAQQSRPIVMARRLVTWVWVRRLGGKQVEVARELRASSSVVARWYSSSAGRAVELDALADDVVRRLRRDVRRGGPAKKKTRVR